MDYHQNARLTVHSREQLARYVLEQGSTLKAAAAAFPYNDSIPMPRDAGLEELVHNAIGNLPGLAEKAMFGGWAYLLHGNLLCGARRGSLMLRVGPGNESWALEIPGVIPVVMRGRRMMGYVRATPEAYADHHHFQRLLDATVAFTRSLPGK